MKQLRKKVRERKRERERETIPKKNDSTKQKKGRISESALIVLVPGTNKQHKNTKEM